MNRDGANESLWQERIPDYIPLTKKDVERYTVFDVAVIGGGITGVTTALLLQKAGKKCLLLEARTLGFGTTGGTTAHLNTMMDNPYNVLIKDFGEDNARMVHDAAQKAIDLVQKNVKEYNIDCGFMHRQAYLFAEDEKQAEELKDISEASKKVGCKVKYADTIPAPMDFKKALVFSDQAQFHPIKYLYALAKAFEEAGGTIIQNCRVTEVKADKPLTIHSDCGNYNADSLIYATHIPPGVNILHFRCAPYRSYAMAVKLKNNEYPDGLVYDMCEPYHYYRTQEVNGEKYLIAGGEDHKTAHEANTQQCFDKLKQYIKKYYKIEEVAYQWSSQYFEPTDGLPYIGSLPGSSENIYVATGFGGNGMIYSHVSAMVLTEMLVSGKSEYGELFNPNRVKPVAGFSNFVKEAVDVVGKFIGKRFDTEKIHDFIEMTRDEAKVVKYEGHTLALYKDANGGLHSVSPVCPHVGCRVEWNNTEKTWDCPCHGSRFNADGEVLTGPATIGLERVDLRKIQETHK